ncbi:MAG: succinate dehydrogenase assembly factor 2 [Hyphomicrobiales bacterium]|nr:succinate dehydrogenase assembly factor 2 [Hyphomicrobiales bacterium]MDE2114696.1 succinate dehydrogenase assembly factor 2 [Hyphomicrobiales bacterium]
MQTHPAAQLDARRKKLLFRSWHRGMREMDLLMGQFADSQIAGLSDAELDDYEALMEAPDPEIFKWLTGTVPVPDNFATSVFAKLRGYHTAK